MRARVAYRSDNFGIPKSGGQALNLEVELGRADASGCIYGK
jgi:hypothetical protein